MKFVLLTLFLEKEMKILSLNPARVYPAGDSRDKTRTQDCLPPKSTLCLLQGIKIYQRMRDRALEGSRGLHRNLNPGVPDSTPWLSPHYAGLWSMPAIVSQTQAPGKACLETNGWAQGWCLKQWTTGVALELHSSSSASVINLQRLSAFKQHKLII